MAKRSDIVGGKVTKRDHSEDDESNWLINPFDKVRQLWNENERTLFDRFVILMKEAGKLYRNLDPVRLAKLLRDATEEGDYTMESLLQVIIETQPRLASHPAISKAVNQSGRHPETSEQAERRHWLRFKNMSNAATASHATRDTIAGWVGRRKGMEPRPDLAFQDDGDSAIYLNPTEVHSHEKALNYAPPAQ
jgi:hypothetical protein